MKTIYLSLLAIAGVLGLSRSAVGTAAAAQAGALNEPAPKWTDARGQWGSRTTTHSVGTRVPGSSLLLRARLDPADRAPVHLVAAQEVAPKPTFENVSYGPHERNVLDFYQAKSEKPTPVLFFIHGGGVGKVR
jgi:acetyl esterase/lipase